MKLHEALEIYQDHDSHESKVIGGRLYGKSYRPTLVALGINLLVYSVRSGKRDHYKKMSFERAYHLAANCEKDETLMTDKQKEAKDIVLEEAKKLREGEPCK